ncbi:hypothetical protein CFter6_3165 [Collimonas fungivorans]|uniref:Uncharacterized protein n=1 Tax=Collimonas fungivorans TaxID=158899 RepID=A0A127PDX8_9BURK|nr:hypothetical protein CFter6_3165 [Collimonas fungivorans]
MNVLMYSLYFPRGNYCICNSKLWQQDKIRVMLPNPVQKKRGRCIVTLHRPLCFIAILIIRCACRSTMQSQP